MNNFHNMKLEYLEFMKMPKINLKYTLFCLA